MEKECVGKEAERHETCKNCQPGALQEPWEYQQFIDEDKIPVVKTYPYALQQACMDRFKYLAFLVAGAVVEFQTAEPINEKWVHLKHCWYTVPGDEEPAKAERGIDVQIDNIVLVMVSP